jgi:hypothetical protein
MNILEKIVGEKRTEFSDFMKRYDQGRPDEGYADDEVRSRYNEVASRLSDDEYEDSAREAFDRMSPQERREFYSQLRQTAGREGFDPSQFNGDDAGRYEDSRELAGLTSRMRREKPDMLSNLLGGNLANSALKGGFAGIAASAIKKFLR